MSNLLDAPRYSPSALAKMAQVNLATVWRWMLTGVRGRKLRSIHFGGRRYVLRADWDAFLVAGNCEPEPASDTAGKSAAVEAQLDAFGVGRLRTKR
jgi:hypothetical protein